MIDLVSYPVRNEGLDKYIYLIIDSYRNILVTS